jgi:hypothetical protein
MQLLLEIQFPVPVMYQWRTLVLLLNKKGIGITIEETKLDQA